MSTCMLWCFWSTSFLHCCCHQHYVVVATVLFPVTLPLTLLHLYYSSLSNTASFYWKGFSNIPIYSQNWTNLALPTALESMSATWFLVGVYANCTAPRWIQSLIKWHRISMCLQRSWNNGFQRAWYNSDYHKRSLSLPSFSSIDLHAVSWAI